MNDKIEEFREEYDFLSNFYYSPIEYDGYIYKDVESAYQAAKTDNPKHKKLIRETKTPKEAKQCGKLVQLRQDWKQIKDHVMEELVRVKFNTHIHLMGWLVATGDLELIEGNNWHDIYWGKCRCRLHSNNGENKLGKILMKIRDELKCAK